MTRLHSSRYPQLRIADLGVRFKDGALETDSDAVIERARTLAHLDVTVGGESAPAAPSPAEAASDGDEGDVTEGDDTAEEQAPRGNASRETWADYAGQVGVAITDEMSRNEIREAVENERSATDWS